MKPMLAATITDVKDIAFPVIGSAKLDGYRAVIPDSRLVSRKLRPFDNQFTTDWFSKTDFDGMDGELIRGSPVDKEVFSRTSSACKTVNGRPRLTLWVFDDFTHYEKPYLERLDILRERVAQLPDFCRVKLLTQKWLKNGDELEEFESELVDQGFEGAMFRNPHGPYKFGRSTMNEQYLMKLKRFEVDTAQVIGFEEEMQNTNPLVDNPMNKTKRSKHLSGMVGKDTLGALRVYITSGPFKGVETNCTGLSAKMKKMIWQNQAKYRGMSIKFKWFPIGSKDKPRHPNFVDFI